MTYLKRQDDFGLFFLLPHYSSKWLNLYYQLYYKNNNYTFNVSAHESNIQLCLSEQGSGKDLLFTIYV